MTRRRILLICPIWEVIFMVNRIIRLATLWQRTIRANQTPIRKSWATIWRVICWCRERCPEMVWLHLRQNGPAVWFHTRSVAALVSISTPLELIFYWGNCSDIIYSYTITDAHQMQMIETAFNEYHRRTCIRFKPRSAEHDYISIVNGNSGCWSSVGRIGGRQVSVDNH